MGNFLFTLPSAISIFKMTVSRDAPDISVGIRDKPAPAIVWRLKRRPEDSASIDIWGVDVNRSVR